MRPLLIGILETGIPPDDYKATYGSYPQMFEQLLYAQDQHLTFRSFAVLDGDIPTDPSICDAWLITGSKFGVYEEHQWISPLCDLIKKAYSADIPFVGICFGHQLIAKALGAKVEKSDKGWSLGVTKYQVDNKPTWMSQPVEEFSIQAYHQDQVLSLPKNTQVIASSSFCPYAGLNIDNKMITFQGHPEFSAQYTKQLLINRRDLNILPLDLSNQAIDNIDETIDCNQVAKWITDFLRFKIN